MAHAAGNPPCMALSCPHFPLTGAALRSWLPLSCDRSMEVGPERVPSSSLPAPTQSTPPSKQLTGTAPLGTRTPGRQKQSPPPPGESWGPAALVGDGGGGSSSFHPELFQNLSSEITLPCRYRCPVPKVDVLM